MKLSEELKRRKLKKAKKAITIEQHDNVIDGNPKQWFGKRAKMDKWKITDPHRSLKAELQKGIKFNI